MMRCPKPPETVEKVVEKKLEVATPTVVPKLRTSKIFPKPWRDGIYPSKGKICKWVYFVRNGIRYPMCVHSHSDAVSNQIAGSGSWSDCNILSGLWKNTKGDGEYMEIGGNIGACVMEMLTQTDAKITVFEPNPANLFCMTSTLNRLPDVMSDRVTVYPYALGEKNEKSTIHAAHHNMGNSVVGQVIKDNVGQLFEEAVPIEVWRYDDVISKDIDVKLMKMDAQGFECNIVRGMGNIVPSLIKTEIADHWLSSIEGCSDKILFGEFHKRNMVVYTENNRELKRPLSPGVYDVIVRSIS